MLDADPAYADAVFNLAQLRMKAGEMAAAKALYERYLALGSAGGLGRHGAQGDRLLRRRARREHPSSRVAA